MNMNTPLNTYMYTILNRYMYTDMYKKVFQMLVIAYGLV